MLLEPPAAQHRIFERACKVAVEVRLSNGRGHGSGIVLSRDGVILTAYHVIKGCRVIHVRRIRLDDDSWVIHPFGKYRADVIWRDAKADLAILKLRKPPKTLAVARLADDDPYPESAIYRVGRDTYELASGYIGTTTALFKGIRELWSGMHIEGGASGGPVFDKQVRVVGIVVRGSEVPSEAPITYIVPISVIRKRLFSKKKVREVLPDWERI
jgi:serine protease Do